MDMGTSDAVRTAVLGVNAWAVALFVPAIHGGTEGALALIEVIAPLAVLAAGVWALRGGAAATPRRAATWGLLAAYPLALALGIVTRPELGALDSYSTPALVVAVLATVAYGAGAAAATARPDAFRAATRKPLGGVAPVPDEPRRRWLRRLLLGAAALGALGLGAIAPSWGERADLERSFGEAAPEAALVAAVIGGALATAIIALFIGPSLRAARDRVPTRPQLTRRAIGWLVAALGGIAVYWVITRST